MNKFEPSHWLITVYVYVVLYLFFSFVFIDYNWVINKEPYMIWIRILYLVLSGTLSVLVIDKHDQNHE